MITREDWLRTAVGQMAPWFEELGCPLPPVRVAIGFTSHGRKGQVIGECWGKVHSADNTTEIFLRPDLAKPVEVLATLAHELAHAAIGVGHGHDKEFGRVARGIHLEGP